MATHRISDEGDRPPASRRRTQSATTFQSLISQARAGSTAAQGLLLERCRRYLLLISNKAVDSDLRPKVGASDIVQETFLDACQDFSSFTGATEQDFLAWLKQMLKNRLCNSVRHYKTVKKRDISREVALDDDDYPWSLSSPDQEISARDDGERLRGALARIPPTMRDVLVLRTWQRLSFPAIAVRLHYSPDAVRKLWARAVLRLQRELQDRP